MTTLSVAQADYDAATPAEPTPTPEQAFAGWVNWFGQENAKTILGSSFDIEFSADGDDPINEPICTYQLNGTVDAGMKPAEFRENLAASLEFAAKKIRENQWQ